MMFKGLHLLALLGAQQSVAFQSTSYTARQTCASSKAFARPWWKPFAAGSDDITTSKSFLKKKFEVLQKEKATLDAELESVKEMQAVEGEEWGQKIESLKTEFSFLQQRASNATRGADIVARVSVVKELLSVLDNYDRSKDSLEAEGDAQEAIVAYYDGVFAKVSAILETYELSVVPGVGSPFDYNVHEAIQQVPSAEYEVDVVCQEYQKGYMIGDTLVRAAVVAVSIGDM